jgi:hypothetical protein
VQPTSGGSGTAPVEGIRHKDYFLGLFRTGSSPYHMAVRAWSDFFAARLTDELTRLGISTAGGPAVHVEVRRLDVSIPKLAGGVTCTLTLDVVVRYPDGEQKVVPVRADGEANGGRVCTGRAANAAVRHILTARWLAGEAATTAVGSAAAVETAELLPGTKGRYGTLWSIHVGGGRARLSGADTVEDQARSIFSLGVTFGLSMTKNLFVTANAYAESSTSSPNEVTLSTGGAGFGAAYYLDRSVLLSAAFMLALPSKDETTPEGPGMGGHLMLGKEWQTSSSMWLGGAVRVFSTWSFEDGSQLLGLALMGTVVFN